ncbi:MAG: caspase family protein [Calothrix sp. C42_A2020_038]|nr:caspase family protein [Calothrix sp. C42_A2020_038]
MSPVSVGNNIKRKQKNITPKIWLLLVGVNTYIDELPSLRYSALDCQGLAEALAMATQQFFDIDITTYHDFAELPILETVRNSLITITTAATSEDTILFYFSGHGIIDTTTQKTYLCLRDTVKADLENTALPLHELLQLLTQSAARHQLIWLDACHSGGMTFHHLQLNPTPQLLRIIQTAATISKGLYAMLSCDTNQQSWEFPELGHGVFTYYLIQGLRGEAADHHGVVTADGLYRYVYHQTLRYIDKTNQQLRLINQQRRSKGDTHLYSEYPLQTPKRIVEGVGDIILAHDSIVENAHRVAMVVEGLTNSTTLTFCKLLRAKGGFDIEYLSAQADICNALQACLCKDNTTTLLYLRGQLEDINGAAVLSFSNTFLSRDWLRQQLRYSSCLYLILILDCPVTDFHTLQTWVDDLQVDTDKGLCIIAGATSNSEDFATALIQTLQAANQDTGLTAAGWITQLQLHFPTPLLVWLSGIKGVIEVIPPLREHTLQSQNTDLGICPYLGLRPFSENDSQYFYGRETLTQQLINHIASQSFLAVVGASGSGKSSVVQAGLIAQLRQGKQLPGSDTWLIYSIRPGANPLETLARKLDGSNNLVLEGLLYQGVEGFVYWLRSRSTMVVLVIDQFEELFTLTPDKDRQNFLQLIFGALEYASDKFKIVITLRADFISSCLDVPNLASLLQKSSLLVPSHLNDDEYRSVITNPAEKVGLQVEPGLIEVLLQELNHSSGDLPLLEFVLDELWHYRHDGKLTLFAYQQHLGGIAGALERKADTLYASLDPQSQACAKWIFLSLTQLGEGTEDTRRRVSKSELVVKKFSPALVEKTLHALTTAKLVVINVEEFGAGKGDNVETDITALQPSVEVIHEILIRHWSTLRWWLEENRSRIRTHRQIEQAAKLWLQNQQANDFLLQGVRLAEAEDIYIKYTDELSDDVQKFIEACLVERKRLQFQEKHRLRQAQRAVVGLSILGIAACSFGGLAYWQAREARLSEIKALNQSSKANLLSNQQLEALVASVKAGKLQNAFVPSDIRLATITILEQVISGIQERNRFEGHNNGVISVAFSPDGQTLASASLDSTVKLWNRHGVFKVLTGHQEAVYSVSFAPDGQTLASAGVDETIKLWKVSDGSLIKTLNGHTQTVNNLVFSPDGKIIASVSSDKTIKLWNVNDGRLIRTINDYGFPVLSVSFSPDGQSIAAGGENRTIKIWDINNGRLLKTLFGHQSWVNTLNYSPDGKTLVSGGADNNIILWNVDTGKPIKTISGHTASVWGVNFSPDNKIIISASRDKTIKLWNLQGHELEEFRGHSNGVYDAEFSPDGTTIASASLDGTLRLWQRRDVSLLDILTGHNNGVYGVVYSPDGSKIASSGGDGLVKLWRRNGQLLKTFAAHSKEIYTIAFAPDGVFATAGSDGAIKMWDDGKLVRTINAHSGDINYIIYSPDGNIASASKDNTVKLWDSKGKLLQTLKHQGEVYRVDFSPDGKTIASASVDKTIKLWQASTGKLQKTITGHQDWVYSVVFSPDGEIIASTSADKTIKLWRRRDGKLLRTLEGHKAEVYTAKFSPDGQIIASTSEDKTIKLWHIDGHLLTTLPEQGAGVMSVNFSPDSKTFVSGSIDNTVKIWRFEDTKKNVGIDTLLKSGCQWLGDYLKNNPKVPADDKKLC